MSLLASTKITPVYVPVSMFSVYQSSYSMIHASIFRLPSGRTENCDVFFWSCRTYYVLSTADEASLLWPLPSFTRDLRSFDLFVKNVAKLDLPLSFNPRRYSVALVLQTRFPDDSRVVVSRDRFLNDGWLRWNGFLVDEDHQPLLGDIYMRDIQDNSSCYNEEYQTVADNILGRLSLLGADDFINFENLLATFFEVASFSTADASSGCNVRALQLMDTTPANRTASLQACLYEPDEEAWANDPCCNTDLSAEQCCFQQPVPVPFDRADHIKLEAIEEYCDTPICMEQFVSDLVNEYQFLQNDSTCSSLAAQTEAEFNEELQVFDSCLNKRKQMQYGDTCTGDGGCATNEVCDSETNRCMQQLRNLDEFFVTCLLDNLDNETIPFLYQRVGVKLSEPQVVLRSAFINATSVKDCQADFAAAFPYQTHWRFEVYDPFCMDDCVDDPSGPALCEHDQCEVSADCGQIFACEREWVLIPGDEGGCEAFGRCNWNDCTSDSDVECEEECFTQAPSDYFCGVCTGDQCRELSVFPGCSDKRFTTEDDCLPPHICPLPTVYDGDRRACERFCFDSAATSQAQCTCSGCRWSNALASGSGLCVVEIDAQSFATEPSSESESSSAEYLSSEGSSYESFSYLYSEDSASFDDEEEALCRMLGYQWWDGRSWSSQSELADQSSCQAAELCVLNDRTFVAPPGTSCDQFKECDVGCVEESCSSLGSDTACFSTTTTQNDCLDMEIAGVAKWLEDEAACVFTTVADQATCLAFGHEVPSPLDAFVCCSFFSCVVSLGLFYQVCVAVVHS